MKGLGNKFFNKLVSKPSKVTLGPTFGKTA